MAAKGKKNSLNVVTRANFSKHLPHVLSQLDTASFVAVDTELSGLCSHRSHRYSAFDDLQQRYTKLCDSAASFALLQFGLGIFTFDEARRQCQCSVFSFHLFPPTSHAGSNSTSKFCMQQSSIAFLAEHKFDFNATFHEGISYLSRHEEECHRGRLGPQTPSGSERASIVQLRKIEDQDFVRTVMERVDRWVEGGATGRLDLPPCNAYQRLLTYQQIEAKYGDRLLVSKMSDSSGSSGSKGNTTYLSVSAPSAEERSGIEAAEKARLLQRLDSDVGFRAVIDRIIERRLPVIGHNCFLDVCHMYDKFIGRLPQSLADFKSELSKHFPVIMDTKMIASLDCDFTGISLSELYEYFGSCKRELLYAPALHSLSEHFHDAGYDAYCTGLAFIGLAHKFSKGASLDPLCVFRDNTSVVNKLFIMQSPYAGGLNLAGADTEPDRSHIFLVSGFPEKWKNSQVCDALAKLLASDDFSVHMGSGHAPEAFVSLKSDSLKEHEMIKAMSASGKVCLDGVMCRWQSFESSRIGSVLGKRDSDESVK